jgi:biopolymer transport protein ExbD
LSAACPRRADARIIIGMRRSFTALILAVAVPFGPTLRSAAARQGQLDERSVVVAVVSAREIYVGKDRVPESDVAVEVSKRLDGASDEKRVVYIKSAPEVEYGVIVRLIDALRARGITRIGLVAEKPKPEAGAGGTGLPRGADGGTAPLPDGVVVEVAPDGRGHMTYAVEGRKVPARSVVARLRERLSRAANKNVIILAPTSVTYAQVVRVIEWAKNAGATAIALEQNFVGPGTN